MNVPCLLVRGDDNAVSGTGMFAINGKELPSAMPYPPGVDTDVVQRPLLDGDEEERECDTRVE